MEFVIDRVSEDSFYENLLIGLPKILEKLPCVADINLERYPPVQHSVICTWEQKHGVLLPEDLRSFYASTNGLLYTYNYTCTDGECDENKITGRIEINGIGELIQIYGYEITVEPGVNIDNDKYEIKLGQDSKVFELVNLYDLGRVTLIYINHRYLPTIWVHNANMKFYFLADDFTTYLRMCIHHLGIPLWQFSFTSEGIPEWSEMIFRLLGPAILPQHKTVEEQRKSGQQRAHLDDYTDIPLNKIDLNIMKTLRNQGNNSDLPVVERGASPRVTKKKVIKPKVQTKIHKKLVGTKK